MDPISTHVAFVARRGAPRVHEHQQQIAAAHGVRKPWVVGEAVPRNALQDFATNRLAHVVVGRVVTRRSTECDSARLLPRHLEVCPISPLVPRNSSEAATRVVRHRAEPPRRLLGGAGPRPRLGSGTHHVPRRARSDPAGQMAASSGGDGDAGHCKAVEQADRRPDREAESTDQRGGREERHRGQEIDHDDHRQLQRRAATAPALRTKPAPAP